MSNDVKLGRAGHLFTFTAKQIADAAHACAAYHDNRESYWKNEQNIAMQRVKDTMSCEVKHVDITGGTRPDVVINYGDPSAYSRMQESSRKWQQHRDAKIKYQSETELYNSQSNRYGREYILTPDDVAYFRLNGIQPND